MTHLKRWTFASLLRADILDRAIPWSRLILQDAHLPTELNLDIRSRLSAVAAWLTPAFLVLASWSPWAVIGALLSAAVVGILNADLYRFFWRHGGARFAAAAASLHMLYLLYSSLIFGLVAGKTFLARFSAPLSKKRTSH